MGIQKILLAYEPVKINILPVLKEIKKIKEYIEREDLIELAKYFDLSVEELFSLASFFDELKTKPENKIIIRVCSGNACTNEGAALVRRQIELLLGIEQGNDAHPKFKLETMSCLGLCDCGPIVMVNDQIFERVLPSDVDDILSSYIK